MATCELSHSTAVRSLLSAVRCLVRTAAVLMIVAGSAAFFLGPQYGESTYDYTRKLSAPQPICSGQVQAEGNRVYVFSEALCAVNVYTEKGDFLFCVRGNRFQNGQATFCVLEDLGIYIYSRNHILYRFDESGVYCGRVANGYLYDADGDVKEAVRGEVIFFADDWYCYESLSSQGEPEAIYLHSPQGEEFICTAEDLAQDEEAAPAGPHYFTVLNSLYVSQNGEIIRLARTPLYLTFFYSPFLGFFTMVAGKLILHLLGKVSFPKTSRPVQPGPPPKTRSSQAPGDEIQ